MDDTPAMSPPSPSRKTPTRSKPRTPLQERSQSQTNEDSARLRKDGRHERADMNIFSATPFPTKPQHILLPSTIRKQKSFRAGENQTLAYSRSQYDRSNVQLPFLGSDSSTEESRGRRAPVLQLKKSVTTLRDMYEAQAENSRPSTAASNAQRPMTASSRLRSVSSSESLSGRHAWEALHKISADDMALLPSLSQSSLNQARPESSFAARITQTNHPLTSSPNYRIYGSSSPKIPVFRDEQLLSSDETEPSSSSQLQQTSSSSPNFVRLGRSSSVVETLNTEQTASSPNLVKLGTSSPGVRTSSSPTPSVNSNGSKKRKRVEEDASSFASRARPMASSPPYIAAIASSSEPSLKSPDSVVMPSSPPEPDSARSQSIGTSSPVYRLPGTIRRASESSSSSSAHASLQAALTSSPMPPIQYPVIRAPSAAAITLNVPKRVVRNASNESGAQFTSRLSPVPSEWDEGLSRSSSRRSDRVEHLQDDILDSDSIAPETTGNESQIRIIPTTEDDHQHEAADELRALPRRNHALRTPPLVPVRTNSLFGTTSSSSGSHSQSRLNSLRTSVDTRLNSMKSFTHSRQNSYMSSSGRPNSSGSQNTSLVVPTWARRYYSGIYRDSFQYLYPSQNNSAMQFQISPPQIPLDSRGNTPSHQSQYRASTPASRHSRRSWQSVRDSVRSSFIDFVPSVIYSKRPRLEARKSHHMVGVGPLVSNPVNAEPVSNTIHPSNGDTIRRVSDQLPPVDPRAHWAGLTEEQAKAVEQAHIAHHHSSPQFYQNRRSGETESVYYDANSGEFVSRSRFTDVPRLHHDRRLNTGSSKSRGFGFPFNQKFKWHAPDVYDDDSTRPSWFRRDVRHVQFTCFILGFVFPFSWFVGAFMPLPHRPESFEDIEKAVHEQQAAQHGKSREMDIVARLQLERHVKGVEELKWQNARWWRTMNRWMCFVGVVVFVLVIVLAVIGTRNNW